MTNNKSQFLHLGAYGRSPRKGEPVWSCVTGITREGARIPGAANHVRVKREPKLLYGGSPPDAGRLAIERADRAYDHGRRRRRLRRDGKAILAGVVSYPVPREVVENDPAEGEIYLRWREMTLQFLIQSFGEHLMSVVEHTDEPQLHLHYYAVPKLLPDGHLNLHEIHPGQRAKWAAKEAGACKKFQDAAYRCGMSRWQDDFWWEVSRHFGHTRFGPKRMRVSRRQRLMERRMEEEKARQQAALAADRDALNDEMAQRSAEVDHERSEIAAARRSAWQTYAEPYNQLKQRHARLMAEAGQCARQSAKEIAALRERVAELEQEASLRFVP